MKIKIEMSMIHFTMLYHYLMIANREVRQKEGLNYELFREAFNELDKQFSEQYTDEHGACFEEDHMLREMLYKLKSDDLPNRN
tara:strand:+ start:1677 stop:1925 length:249 start_codon:yes stop_codon:yes gene_type:complete